MGSLERDRLPWLLLRLTVAGAVATTLTVAGTLLVFAYPMGDDFCNAVNVRELGLLGCVRNDYMVWGGRWAPTLLSCGFPAAFDLTKGYPFGLAAVLGILVASLWLLVTSVLPVHADRRLAGSLTLTLLAIYFAGMPHPGESLYWLEGAYVYSLNLSLSMILIVALVRLPERASLGRSMGIAALALFALVTAAFHELFALVLIGVLVVGTALGFRFRDPRRHAWGVAACGALVGIVSIAVAPGNESRQGFYPEGRNVFRAVAAALQMWFRVLDAPVGRGDPVGSASALGWVVDGKLLAATFLFATSPRLRSLTPHWLEREPRVWKVIVPAAWLGLLTGSFLAAGWVLGRTLPLRALNGLYLVFLLGWFLTVLVYARGETSPSPDHTDPRIALLRVASALVLALGLLVSTNVKQGLRDLGRGWAPAFHREMEHRSEAAREVRARGGVALEVAPIEPWPSSYFRHDIDKAANLRQCVADYFDLETIRFQGSRE